MRNLRPRGSACQRQHSITGLSLVLWLEVPFSSYIMPSLVPGLLPVVCGFQNLGQEVSVHLGDVGLSDLNTGDILVPKKKKKIASWSQCSELVVLASCFS